MGVLSGLGGLSAHCASTECDQYSDCAQGYTCAAGKCVLPPGPTDAAADTQVAPGTDGAASHDSATAVDGGARDAPGAVEASLVDALREGGHEAAAIDGMTSEAAGRDATSRDASFLDAGSDG
jgi:hypothetical protein